MDRAPLMVENDPLGTQRDASLLVASDLRAAGFEDAEQIGHGGFGAVYRCRQVGLDRTVAVKVLTEELGEEDRARFVREQRAMGRLTGYPNIATVLEAGVTGGGRPYLVMPYYPLDSLEARIRRDGPLAVDEVLTIGAGIARALESAHRLGILHRDVKPGNILLTDAGEPALADFGIARVAGGFETATGVVSASPAFTAPEVLEGRTPTPAADVYGLGATLFCALTGHAAYERRSGEQLVAQFVRISRQPVPDLRDSGIPDEVCTLVESAMHRDPEQRPSVAGLCDMIRRVQRHRELNEILPQGDSRAPRIPHQTLPRVAGNGEPLTELTSFVGRRAELSELKNLLTGYRLVTLVGPGGVGKTRLALRAASVTRREFADGVSVIELAEVHDPSLVADVVAAAVGVRVESSRPVEDLLVESLRSRETLLVVDNCEQIVDSVASLAESLLHACPKVRILATSREPLDIGGEMAQRLSPLAVPSRREPTLRELPKYDAVTLFSERAAAIVPGFALTEKNKAAVVAICSRLDGLPLAIELAAARMRTMSPEQILQRLTDRFELLTRGSRTAPTRQQTLSWCTDWSYELCTQGEQRLWARLSVFVGGFELDAVELVCGAETAAAELVDALSGLVDKSIVVREEPEGVVRFRMLETVRDYGLAKLRESGEEADLLRRHRNWCLRLMLDAEADLISDKQLAWLNRVHHEEPNLRAALEFCESDHTEESAAAGLRTTSALYVFWTVRGQFGEGRRWLDRALAHPCASSTSTSDQVRALYADISLAAMQRDLQRAATLLEQGHALLDQDHTPWNEALIAFAEADLAIYLDEPVRAASCVGRAIEVFGSDTRSWWYVSAMLDLGVIHARLGDIGQAIECYQRILSITEPCGEWLFRSLAMWELGLAVWQQGDRGRAQELQKEALRFNRRVRNPIFAALGLEALAWIVVDSDGERAAVLMGAADDLMRSAAGSIVFYFPELDQFHLDYERMARKALGDKHFNAAWGRGRSMGFDAAVAYALEEAVAETPSTGPATLTKREREVAALVAGGLTNKQIATRLVISQRTAQGHVEHILAKLGFTSRAQIAAWIAEESR
ncbi:protein kinase domain-containing protein [Nocardia sp. CA-151230]|uniref:protein kinase domain-containing protein n=1 Tax=Nocardia sp. CA-151230 TaxID=3239982 RepID=UPI003D8C97B7